MWARPSRLGNSDETSVFCFDVCVLPKEEVLLGCVPDGSLIADYSLHAY